MSFVISLVVSFCRKKVIWKSCRMKILKVFFLRGNGNSFATANDSIPGADPAEGTGRRRLPFGRILIFVGGLGLKLSRRHKICPDPNFGIPN